MLKSLSLCLTYQINLFFIGINFPKGIIFHFGKHLLISKDGISNILKNYNLKNAVLARFLGFFESIFFLILMPFMLLSYAIIFLVSMLIVLILLIPYILNLLLHNTKINFIFNTFLLFMIGSIISILAIIGLFILFPLQILIPEINTFLFKIDLWSMKLIL